MEQVTMIGVTPDGEALLLQRPGGAKLSLPLDERVRAAVRGDRGRQLEMHLEGSVTPREIQARIRAGQSIDEVVDALGESRERVQRFAEPVIGERVYIAEQARSSALRGRRRGGLAGRDRGRAAERRRGQGRRLGRLEGRGRPLGARTRLLRRRPRAHCDLRLRRGQPLGVPPRRRRAPGLDVGVLPRGRPRHAPRERRGGRQGCQPPRPPTSRRAAGGGAPPDPGRASRAGAGHRDPGPAGARDSPDRRG